MARWWTLALLLSAALFACIQAPTEREALLNSERIQQRFGSYGVRVLRQDGDLRVACLYSTEANGEVCRTVAVTLLDEPLPAELAVPSAAIRAGASLGATLKTAGWTVVKRDHVLNEQASGTAFAALLDWPCDMPPPRVAVDAYALWAERPGQSFRFARIAEAHHPDYLGLGDLKELVPPGERAPSTQQAGWPELERALAEILQSISSARVANRCG
jgi:hypothetical protein